MAAEYQGSYTGDYPPGGPPVAKKHGVASGLIYFASALLCLVGVFHAITGLSAIFNDSFFTTVNGYSLEIDVTAWGWFHLVGGIAAVIAGAYLLTGNLLARIIAVFFALGSATAAFWSIPYYPAWNIVILALDALIIWAVAFHGQEFKNDIT